MRENAEYRVVGDDDSGPEDAEDDFDLECESLPLSMRIQKQINEAIFQQLLRIL